MFPPSSPRLRAHTSAIEDPGPLADYLPNNGGIAWLRRGDGLIGLGEIARFTTKRELAAVDAGWRDFTSTLDIKNDLPDVPGSGPLLFGSLTFDPANTRAKTVFIIPEMIIGRRNGQSWITTISRASRDAETVGTIGAIDRATPGQPRHHSAGHPNVASVSLDIPGWKAAVSAVLARLDDSVTKVVLARAEDIELPTPLSVHQLVSQLTDGYPMCWTFHLDGLVGASPEMLVRRDHELAMSRVLAGTIIRDGEGEVDKALATALSQSSKDLVEHQLAVASVASKLAQYCTAMNVPDAPSVLHLPNVLHLASEVTGIVRNGASVLELAAALHPTAAVCGTPTEVARKTIAELEHLDRGRYAAPVGWMDATGDGEFAIALRCGQIDKRTRRHIRLYAGCGIVDGSHPETEYQETQAKLAPMRKVLGLIDD